MNGPENIFMEHMWTCQAQFQIQMLSQIVNANLNKILDAIASVGLPMVVCASVHLSIRLSIFWFVTD